MLNDLKSLLCVNIYIKKKKAIWNKIFVTNIIVKTLQKNS